MIQYDPLIGQQISNYQIIALINAGAFGVIYKARHLHLQGRVVAIKLLRNHFASPKEYEEFSREAEILEKLQHPQILSLLDFGFSRNQPYLITPYAPGGSLRDVMYATGGPLRKETTLRLLQQIGQGLQYAHQQGIIHRDLKPANILLSDEGAALIADFGLSSTIISNSSGAYNGVAGTYPYMAPEQFRGEINTKGDQYALACIAYEMVTGRRPFESTIDSFGAWNYVHTYISPAPICQLNPDVPAYVDQAILRALAKDHRERFPDVIAFLDALKIDSSSLQAQSIDQEIYIKTHRKEPEITAYSLKHLLDMGSGLYHQGNYNQALTAYERALQSNGASAIALRGKGDTLRKLKRHMDALATYDQALTLEPDNITTLLSKGQLFDEMALPLDALSAYDQAISRKPRDPLIPIVLCHKAKAFLHMKNDLKALITYSQALDIDPAYGPAREGKEQILLRWKNYASRRQTLLFFDDFLRRRPGDVLVMAYKCDTLYRLQLFNAAVITYEQALALDPSGLWLNRLRPEMHYYHERFKVYKMDLVKYNSKKRRRIITSVIVWLLIPVSFGLTLTFAERPDIEAWLSVCRLLFFISLIYSLIRLVPPVFPFKNR